MASSVHVHPSPPRPLGSEQEVSARVQWPRRLARFWQAPLTQQIWFRVPADLVLAPEAIGDAYLLAVCFRAMRLGCDVRIHAPVSDGLPERLGRLADLWHERKPASYRRCAVVADGQVAGTPRAGPSILCFSGGLDSAYSLHRHTRPGAEGLGAALMIHGADVPVAAAQDFEQAFARSRRMAQSRGVALLRATTNLRDVRQHWTHSFTAGMGAVLTLFRGRFARGLLAVGFTEEEARRWWPQDLTDPPLCAAPTFPLAGDGYEADRYEKLEALVGWPEALRDLRVCMDPGTFSRNCGSCAKCVVLGIFGLIALGRTPPCLPREIGEAEIRANALAGDVNWRLRYQQALKHARRKGVHAPWVELVERLLGTGSRSQAGAS